MIDLTTLAAVKQLLGIANANSDAVLQSMITASSVAVQQWLGRDLELKQRTELYDGSGKQAMLPLQWPVSSVASVKVNGVSVPSAAGSFTAPGFRWDDTMIIIQGEYALTKGRRNIEVIYTAGYAPESVPADIAAACAEIVAQRYKERDWIGLQSKGLGGETISYAQLGQGHGRSVADGGIPPAALAKLSQYKRVHA